MRGHACSTTRVVFLASCRLRVGRDEDEVCNACRLERAGRASSRIRDGFLRWSGALDSLPALRLVGHLIHGVTIAANRSGVGMNVSTVITKQTRHTTLRPRDSGTDSSTTGG